MQPLFVCRPALSTAEMLAGLCNWALPKERDVSSDNMTKCFSRSQDASRCTTRHDTISTWMVWRVIQQADMSIVVFYNRLRFGGKYIAQARFAT